MPLAGRQARKLRGIQAMNAVTARRIGMNKLDQLREAYQRHEVILFVGDGVSQSLGLPPWGALIDHMAKQLRVDPQRFRGEGSYLTLAEYFRLQRGSIGPLRSWMDREWHHSRLSVDDSRVHELIVKGGFRIIYTTNYDRWLEIAFEHHGEPFVKIVSVADLSRIRADVTQIIKFHGDLENDDSIVLDESSYFRRLDFESPLDIKLRADVLGRSVLFIGYSLGDINIRYLFYKLSRLWQAAVPHVPQPRSYIFSPQRNPVQEAVLAQWGIDMIAIERDDPTQALVEFLEGVIDPAKGRIDHAFRSNAPLPPASLREGGSSEADGSPESPQRGGSSMNDEGRAGKGPA